MGSRVGVVLTAALVAVAFVPRYSLAGATRPPARGGAVQGAVASANRPLTWHSHELGPASFSAAACAGQERCVAFGLGGTLATSEDGGRTWSLAASAALRGLTVLAAACPSPERCVALGEQATPQAEGAPLRARRGVALFSVDGGRSWSRAPVRGGAVQLLGGLACPSETTCYATAANLAMPPRQADLLLESHDGGTSWTTRIAGPPGGLRGALACSGVERCVAAGGTDGVVATADGGRRWTNERLPMGGGGMVGLAALACVSPAVCVGVGTAPHPGVPVIVTSDDGGVSWRFAPVSAEGSLTTSVGDATGTYATVSCSQRRCAAVAETLPGLGLVAMSGDGGRTWREQSLGPGGSFAAVTCAAAGGCLAAGSTGNGAATIALSGADSRWSEPYVGPGTSWSALSCPSSRHCVAGGMAAPVPVAAAVMASEDGGAQWSAGRLPAGLTGITALDCPTTSRCLGLGEVTPSQRLAQDGNEAVATVLSSGDGGLTWRRDRIASPPIALDALSCPTSSLCYAVGATVERPGRLSTDAVVRTTDGGARWVAEPLPAFPPQPVAGTSGSEILGGGLTSISCFNARSCLAGGPAGVLATSDGRHWQVVEATPGPGDGGVVVDGILFGELQALSCPARSRCVGAFSTPNGEVGLRLSTDGGRIWHPVDAPALNVTALVCPSRSECLLAGSGPNGAVVLESLDGGRHFRVAPVPPLGAAPLAAVASPSYDALSCADPAHCVVLGAGAIGEVAVAR